MTIVSISDLDIHKRTQAIGWFLSCAFHGSLIIGSFFFVQQVRLAPQPEPFKWNVAIVSSDQAMVDEKVVPVPPPPQPLEAKAAAKRTIVEAVKAPEPLKPKPTKVDPPPPLSPAPIQEATLPSAPATTVPQPLKLPEPTPEPTPVPQISVPEPTPKPLPIEQAKLPEPKLASPPRPVAEVAKPEPKPPEPTPAIEQARIPDLAPVQPPPQKVKQADIPPEPAQITEALPQPPVQERVHDSVVQKPLQSTQPVQPVQTIPTPPMEAPPKVAQQPTTPPVQQSQSANEMSNAVPVPPVLTSKPEAPQVSTNMESRPITAPTQVSPEPMHEQVASLSPTPAPVRSKPDYRWLSELIVKRVEELKRYPADARLEQAEGKVVVKVVIREDGSVSETEIVKSSGFRTLDEAALDLMRRSGPFTFPHPLGKPSLTIKVPINYALERP